MSGNESESEPEEEEQEEEQEEFTRRTFYFRPDTKRSFERWIREVELKHEFMLDEKKSKQNLYNEIVEFAMENEDQLIDRVRENLLGQE